MTKLAEEQGTRALDNLRQGVEQALQILVRTRGTSPQHSVA